MTTTASRPAAVWLFAGGPMQRRAAEAIKRRGFALILTDGSDTCVLRPLADEFVHLDTFDMEENIEKGKELAQRYDIRAVFTAGADCHETVASVARSLGLHGIDPAISHLCRFKYETRDLLTKAGIPQPRFSVVGTFVEARAALAMIGLPAALKATDNSGSRGFSRIEKAEDLTEETFDLARSFGTTGKVIIEELLIPVAGEIAEQSVETVWYDGAMTWLNWVDRLFRKDFAFVEHPWRDEADPYQEMSWAVELAHVNPAVHAEDVRREVETLIERAGRAIGMGEEKGGHILKADIMLTTRGPMILELTPRLSGGWDSSYSTPSRGADFVEGALSLALGEPFTEELRTSYFTYAAQPAFSAVLAQVEPGARDCIGREFAGGTGEGRGSAIAAAAAALSARRFLK